MKNVYRQKKVWGDAMNPKMAGFAEIEVLATKKAPTIAEASNIVSS